MFVARKIYFRWPNRIFFPIKNDHLTEISFATRILQNSYWRRRNIQTRTRLYLCLHSSAGGRKSVHQFREGAHITRMPLQTGGATERCREPPFGWTFWRHAHQDLRVDILTSRTLRSEGGHYGVTRSPPGFYRSVPT